MRKILILFTLYSASLFSQVGVGTTVPHPDVMLDVNGALRVRSYNEGNDFAAKDSIAVFDGRGVLHRVAAKKILANVEKSLVKAKLTSNFAVALLSYIPIVFNSEDFDIKDEFNSTTGVFTATDAGIYRVAAQIKTSSLSVGDLGLAIYKTNSAGTSSTKIAEERFVNVSVVLNNVSPPTRSVSTLVQLTAGEKIDFRLYSLVNVSIAGAAAGYDSFCTIEQVR